MGYVQAMWDCDQCYSADGIFFADDTVILLSGDAEAGYKASERQPISQPGAGWTGIGDGDTCKAKGKEFTVVAGGGATEGEGFVALLDRKRKLVWLLHLSDSEAFTEVAIRDGKVIAVAEEYPFRNEFRIPIGAPQALEVRSVNEP